MSLPPSRLHRSLARLLEVGTLLASAIVAIGLLLPRTTVVLTGIGLFISLPIVRVVVMLATFARERDRWGAMIAGTVLMIIALGVALGAVG